MRLFLGVDGGQSGTLAMIGDETGRVVGAGEGGPCNHAAAGEGRRKLERAVAGSVGAACAQAGLDAAAVRFEAACFGMSGGPDDKREILAGILRAERLIVTNDAVIALAGATATGQGIITIAGTGSIAFGRNAAGRTARAGGWGYIFGDEGGGFDIARQALRAALRMEEGWGPPTSLREILLAETGARDVNDVLHRFYTAGLAALPRGEARARGGCRGPRFGCRGGGNPARRGAAPGADRRCGPQSVVGGRRHGRGGVHRRRLRERATAREFPDVDRVARGSPLRSAAAWSRRRERCWRPTGRWGCI